jgi:hypothetical protein
MSISLLRTLPLLSSQVGARGCVPTRRSTRRGLALGPEVPPLPLLPEGKSLARTAKDPDTNTAKDTAMAIDTMPTTR